MSLKICYRISNSNCNCAVRDDSHINLYPYSILSISPEGLDAQVPFHPFENFFHDPSIFIKKGYIPGFQIEIVRIVCKGSFEFRFIIYDSSDFGRVVFCVSLGGEPYKLSISIWYNLSKSQ